MMPIIKHERAESQELHAARSKGYWAHASGKTQAQNPYNQYTQPYLWEAWNEGFELHQDLSGG